MDDHPCQPITGKPEVEDDELSSSPGEPFPIVEIDLAESASSSPKEQPQSLLDNEFDEKQSGNEAVILCSLPPPVPVVGGNESAGNEGSPSVTQNASGGGHEVLVFYGPENNPGLVSAGEEIDEREFRILIPVAFVVPRILVPN